MGIEKIPNFSSNSAGNIDNFTVNTSFDNWNPDLNCNNNCTALDYNGKINSTTNYTLTLNIINKLTDDQINSYDSQFINSFSYKENGDIIFATRDSITEYNSNGDRLSVILGEDSVNYKGDIINNLNGDIKGVTDNSTFTASVFTEGATDSSQKYYPLVYYLESSPNSSEYHFDENGLLTDLNNISAIDIKNHWGKGDKTKQYRDTDLTYTYDGKVYWTDEKGKEIKLNYAGYDKQTESLRYKFPPQIEDKRIFRIKIEEDRRVFTPVARDSMKWKREYKKRTSVERENGRIDRDYGFERHTIRGQKKMTMYVTMGFIVQLSMAKGKIEQNIKERLSALVA